MALSCRPALFCAILADYLTHAPGIEVVAAAVQYADLLGTLHVLAPHVVVVDLDAFLAHLDVFRQVTTSPDGPRALVVASPDDADAVVEALRAGAWGAVFRTADPTQLVSLIRAAASGLAWESLDYAGHLTRSLTRVPTGDGGIRRAVLTDRERQLVAELVAGASNADIASALGLRTQTVKNRLSAIFDKVGVSTRLELALYAVRHGLVDRQPPPDGGTP
ncbi:MAG: response regulator transcription factor [Vicinamibacterales bacterium]